MVFKKFTDEIERWTKGSKWSFGPKHITHFCLVVWYRGENDRKQLEEGSITFKFHISLSKMEIIRYRQKQYSIMVFYRINTVTRLHSWQTVNTIIFTVITGDFVLVKNMVKPSKTSLGNQYLLVPLSSLVWYHYTILLSAD